MSEEAKKQEKESAEQPKGEKLHLIVFPVGKEEYAVPIEQVKEVVLTPAITELPMAPDYILGVANVRGDILAMVDIYERLQSRSARHEKGTSFTLVLESDSLKVGVVVDDMPNTIVVYESELEEAPDFGEEEEDPWVKNIIKTEDKLRVLIDLHHLTDSREIAQAYAAAQ